MLLYGTYLAVSGFINSVGMYSGVMVVLAGLTLGVLTDISSKLTK